MLLQLVPINKKYATISPKYSIVGKKNQQSETILLNLLLLDVSFCLC